MHQKSVVELDSESAYIFHFSDKYLCTLSLFNLGHNNAVESRYSLLKDFIRTKRGFKKLSNIPRYINGRVYIHNLFKDLAGDKYVII